MLAPESAQGAESARTPAGRASRRTRPTPRRQSLLLAVSCLATAAHAKVVDFEVDVGGVPDDPSLTAAWLNGGLMNSSLASLAPGDELVLPNKTFHMMGGIVADGLADVTVRFEGTVVYDDSMKEWPRQQSGGRVLECLKFSRCTNLTLTSSGKALFNGQGKAWWGLPGVGYLARGEDRPRLLDIEDSAHTLVENLYLQNSPYWTFNWHGAQADGLEVRNVDISARRDGKDDHGLIEETAFNTDGFDVAGKNVHIHDCTVWNQDDTVCAKDGSENMLFERIEASGVGLTIGSIGGNSVNRNITFRDIHMHKPVKGIYMKFRGNGLVEDITYENIVIDEPEQTAIWIGPAQQSDSVDLCAAHPCSICWPLVPGAKCGLPDGGQYRNITLRNVTINNPKKPDSYIMANVSVPMDGVRFIDVVVNNPGTKKGKNFYTHCEGVARGVATGKTSPVPPCFMDMTVRSPHSVPTLRTIRPLIDNKNDS
jgi:hypothetical protein